MWPRHLIQDQEENFSQDGTETPSFVVQTECGTVTPPNNETSDITSTWNQKLAGFPIIALLHYDLPHDSFWYCFLPLLIPSVLNLSLTELAPCLEGPWMASRLPRTQDHLPSSRGLLVQPRDLTSALYQQNLKNMAMWTLTVSRILWSFVFDEKKLGLQKLQSHQLFVQLCELRCCLLTWCGAISHCIASLLGHLHLQFGCEMDMQRHAVLFNEKQQLCTRIDQS